MAVKHTIRDAKGAHVEVELTTRKAIKRFCLECMGFQQAEIARCTAPLCPLFQFRLGDSHTLSPEQREQSAKRAQGSTFGRKEVVG